MKIEAIKSPVLLIGGDNNGIDLNHAQKYFKSLITKIK
jgi:hypothetical protein